MSGDRNLYDLCEAVIAPQSSEPFYNGLDSYLNQYGMSVGENLTNPKLPYVDPNQKGLYLQNFQIGKLEVTLMRNKLILDNIASYNEGQGLVKKIFPYIKQYATEKGLQVQSELVNPYTLKMFQETFSDWIVRKVKGHVYLATQP